MEFPPRIEVGVCTRCDAGECDVIAVDRADGTYEEDWLCADCLCELHEQLSQDQLHEQPWGTQVTRVPDQPDQCDQRREEMSRDEP